MWHCERGNVLLPLHGLLFPISSKVLLYAPSHKQNSAYHTQPLLHRSWNKKPLNGSTMKDRSITSWANPLTMELLHDSNAKVHYVTSFFKYLTMFIFLQSGQFVNLKETTLVYYHIQGSHIHQWTTDMPLLQKQMLNMA